MLNKALIVQLGLCVCLTAVAQNKDSLRTEQLDSAKVTAETVRRLRGNEYVLSSLQVEHAITTFGEPDIIRSISSLPGIAQGVEGTMAIFVRGANNGGNRIEYDGVPVGNASHLFGFMSAINTDMVSETVFRPGGIDARYGDLSSSIVTIKRRNALDISSSGKLSISPFFQSFYAGLPSPSRRFGLQFSARTSPVPMIGKWYLKNHKTEFDSGMDGYVYDVNISADVQTGDNSRLDMMFYNSCDDFTYSESTFTNNTTWGVTAAKAGWTCRLSASTDLFAKAYYMNAESAQQQDYLRLESNTEQYLCSAEVRAEPLKNLVVSGGVEYSRAIYRPAGDEMSSRHFSAFLEAGYAFPGVLDVKFGLRKSRNLDWRFLADYYVSKNFGVELSADQLTQYHHVVEGLPTGWSLDISIPSDSAFPEETTRQLYAGFFNSSHIGGFWWKASLGAYFRKMRGLVCFKTGVNLFRMTDFSWEEETDKGEGRSAGLETAFSGKSRHFDIDLAYTLSNTTRRFEQINNGEEFPYKFDRRHILNLQGRWHSGRHSIGALLSYATGHRETLPVSVYQGVAPPLWGTNNTRTYTVEYGQNIRFRQEMSKMNGFKLDDYFRVDVAYTFEYVRPKCRHRFSFSVYNVLNRHNPYIIFVKDGIWKQLSILPVMPSLRWAIEF